MIRGFLRVKLGKHSRPLAFSCLRCMKMSTGQFKRMTPMAPGDVGPMMSRQKELPPIPVAPLQITLDRYLETLKLLLTAEQFKETEKVIKEFRKKDGEGEKLHKQMNILMSNQGDWLPEQWMEEKFLKDRNPMLFNFSPALMFPRQKFKSRTSQLRHAARLAAGVLDFKYLIDRQLLEPEIEEYPLDMSQYQKMFSTYRVPCINCDKLEFHPSKETREQPSRDVIVIHNNQLFSINACDFRGIPYNEHQIMAQLRRVVDMSQKDGDGLGLLTAGNRDIWANAYRRLSQNPKNAESLEAIKRAAFVLCLDKRPNVEEHSDELTCARQVFLGGNDGENGANRWLDKTVQLIVGESGHNGFLMDHTPIDGRPMLFLADHCWDYMEKCGTIESAESLVDDVPRKLKFDLSDDDLHDIMAAESTISRVRDDAELAIFEFPSYGKDLIKSHQMSPDSFLQMAMQLAFYKTCKVPSRLQQAVGMRTYAHGRSAVFNVTSFESLAFCRAFESQHSSAREKEARLREAAIKHKHDATLAKNGLGVDFLLLGLKATARSCGMALPSLYQDEGYRLSKHTRIFSSQVPARGHSLPLFGPIFPDSYSIFYRLQPDSMSFTVTCHASCPETSTVQLKYALEQSLLQMRDCVDGRHTKRTH